MSEKLCGNCKWWSEQDAVTLDCYPSSTSSVCMNKLSHRYSDITIQYETCVHHEDIQP